MSEAKTNDGEGPELLRSSPDGCTSGHAESLAATLAEHRQHLASIQVLINQLKDVAPSIRNSISELTEEVNSLSSSFLRNAIHHRGKTTPISFVTDVFFPYARENGHIWQNGSHKNELEGIVSDDVPEAPERWNAMGIKDKPEPPVEGRCLSDARKGSDQCWVHL